MLYPLTFLTNLYNNTAIFPDILKYNIMKLSVKIGGYLQITNLILISPVSELSKGFEKNISFLTSFIKFFLMEYIK